MGEVQKYGCVEVTVDASIEDVWQVVADVTRVGEWSHECRSAQWLGGASRSAPGVRFRGRNRAGWARWGRTNEIVLLEAPRVIAWRTVPTTLFPDSTRWQLALTPTADGTVITQSFGALRSPPWLLDRFYAALIPRHRDRDGRLAADLARIGAIARRRVPS